MIGCKCQHLTKESLVPGVANAFACVLLLGKGKCRGQGAGECEAKGDKEGETRQGNPQAIVVNPPFNKLPLS